MTEIALVCAAVLRVHVLQYHIRSDKVHVRVCLRKVTLDTVDETRTPLQRSL